MPSWSGQPRRTPTPGGATRGGGRPGLTDDEHPFGNQCGPGRLLSRPEQTLADKNKLRVSKFGFREWDVAKTGVLDGWCGLGVTGAAQLLALG